MTRLRFIVDRPRGPRGGNNDARHLYSTLDSAKTAAMPKKEQVWNNRIVSAARPEGAVLCVDLDELLPVGADLDEQIAYHERRMLHHDSELMRLREAPGPAVAYLTAEDMAELREVVSEWDAEEDRLRRGGGATPAARGAYFKLRDLWLAGKLGGPASERRRKP